MRHQRKKRFYDPPVLRNRVPLAFAVFAPLSLAIAVTLNSDTATEFFASLDAPSDITDVGPLLIAFALTCLGASAYYHWTQRTWFDFELRSVLRKKLLDNSQTRLSVEKYLRSDVVVYRTAIHQALADQESDKDNLAAKKWHFFVLPAFFLAVSISIVLEFQLSILESSLVFLGFILIFARGVWFATRQLDSISLRKYDGPLAEHHERACDEIERLEKKIEEFAYGRPLSERRTNTAIIRK